MNEPVLVCAAVEAELAAWHPRVAAMDHAAHLRIGGQDVLAVPLGIGPVEAAVGAVLALQRFRPRLAILTGTCGALPGSGLARGTVVAVERARLTTADVAAGLSYVPGPDIEATADPGLLRRLRDRGVPAVACATAAAITSDAERASLLGKAGYAVEHMEAAGFLRAAARCGVPAACVLGIANEVGPDASAQWRAHGAAAAAAALSLVEKLIEA
jgi:nucleoside phosphorylase